MCKIVIKSGFSSFITLIGSSLINGLCPVFVIYITSYLISLVECNIGYFNRDIFSKILTLLIFLFFITALEFVINSINPIIVNLISLRVSNRVENIIADKFQYISQETIDDPKFLDLYENAIDKCSYEPVAVVENLLSIMAALVSLSSYVILIGKYNIRFVVFIFLTAFPFLIFKNKANGKLYNYISSKTMKLRQMWYCFILISKGSYAKEVRTFRLFDYIKEKRAKLFNSYLEGYNKVVYKEIRGSALTSFLSVLSAMFIEYFIIKDTLIGKIDVASFYLYNSAILALELKLISLFDLVASGNKSMTFLNYLIDFLKLPNKSRMNGQLVLDQYKLITIEFKNVAFKYPFSQDYSLEDINLKFELGKQICLVGKNGSGKTTLIKLLLRIYEPTKGEILLNNIPVNEYDIDEYRKLFGVAFQDYINYAVNIQESIGFGRVESVNDIENIRRAAKLSKASDFIEKFEKGYLTNLSKMFFEDGKELSIGQQQKLAITRALYSDALVLILDEPTASLDPEAEDELFRTFGAIKDNKMLIMISHRMYSARLSDQIILLSQGRIIEQGTHLELMAQAGAYAKMYNLQADKYKKG